MGQHGHTTVAKEDTPPTFSDAQPPSVGNEKPAVEHLERSYEPESNLTYDDVDEEPELHARTYVALLSMFMLNLVQVVALQGPPAVVGD